VGKYELFDTERKNRLETWVSSHVQRPQLLPLDGYVSKQPQDWQQRIEKSNSNSDLKPKSSLGMIVELMDKMLTLLLALSRQLLHPTTTGLKIQN